jgi:transcriptional regulator with XRE-family HTH domain
MPGESRSAGAAVTIAAEMVALVRLGSLGELGDAAKVIYETVGSAGYTEAAERYTKPRKRHKAACALLDVLGWENVENPVPVVVYLDAHRGALLRAASHDLDYYARRADHPDTPDEERARAEADGALLEKLIAAIKAVRVMVARDLELVALGRVIRRLRNDRGLSMASLASKSGVSAKNLNLIELGQTNPVLTTLHPLCVALGVTPGQVALAAEDERELIAFGRAIRQVREQRGMSVDALASAAEIASTDVQAIEDGHLDAGYRRMRHLAAALGITSTALLARVEKVEARGARRDAKP